MNSDKQLSILDKHFCSIEKIILLRQDPITGLLPASTAVNAHGDYTDAWVRDNVYSILSVWGLALSYKKYDAKHERSYTLSQSVVKLMRGLLSAMMRQSDRIEKFKHTLNPTDALHAKYGTTTGLAVVGDDEWGHLQLDASSLYLLMLSQMTASGLQIIYTIDEVNFIQNMVHYISRTYCTPDYGIWERGNKINHGTTEINGSSVGMAKAALEAINGFNLFGDVNSNEAVIHVIASDIARSRSTLYGLLPRESNSKETDAALLSIIGYPGYAIEDKELVELTREKIITKLAGNYGCKRFLLDGHQSSIEDASRLHYEPSELREFEDIESEWPLFFTYLLLDALMHNDSDEIQKWQQKLEPLFVEEEGQMLLPELYIVPKESIEAEKQEPKSQLRVPNENLPLVWAQSLYMLSEMIMDGVLSPEDIDPLNRRKRIGHELGAEPLVFILAENEIIKKQLEEEGFKSETLQEIQPVKVLYASELSEVHTFLGKNKKLGLSGRPNLVTRTITTSQIHLLGGEQVLFLPYYFNPKGFYFSYDNKLLVEHFRSSLKFLLDQWDQTKKPIIPFLVREDMLLGSGKKVLFELLDNIRNNRCRVGEVEIKPLRELLDKAAIERIDYIHDFKLNTLELVANSQSNEMLSPLSKTYDSSIMEVFKKLNSEDDSSLIISLLDKEDCRIQVYALSILNKRHGKDFKFIFDNQERQLSVVAQELYESATLHHNWAVVRRIAEITQIYDDRLEDVLLDIIIRHKRLAVGRAYSEKATFSKPHESLAILKIIKEFCGNNPAESVLTQEIILHLGHLIRTEPKLFENMITLRTWSFVQLLVGQISRLKSLSFGDAYEYLLGLAPHDIYDNLRTIIQSFSREINELHELENLHVSGISTLESTKLPSSIEENSTTKDWAHWRQNKGIIGGLPSSFYEDVWSLLQKCNGLVIGDKYSIQNRIGSELTLESTIGERSFELRIDGLLQSIPAPDYRQLNIEAIESLARLFSQSPQLFVEDDLVLDVLIGHAVRISWKKYNTSDNYDEQRGQAWEAMYMYSPQETDKAFIDAFMHLLTPDKLENEHIQ
ncbi:glycosyl hydrolase family 15 [Sulfurimonas aquatica]|uniref:Glycosyl hydrolase family 15 n=1 Tax=Sulfurimonas aquatica TaxID=2672570 RepID=A0A975GCW3_9BACT|nr:glycoside hydrolase family 15 protein [Sulfurimonas aquatica]QSZ41932.1 glycosyl hydrolase family 15 [Sulfurimonas aquatica]